MKNKRFNDSERELLEFCEEGAVTRDEQDLMGEVIQFKDYMALQSIIAEEDLCSSEGRISFFYS